MAIAHYLLEGHDPPQIPRGTECVTIVVGTEQQKSVVHKDLICASSEYFRAALQGALVEAATSEIMLMDERPEVFEGFVNWLYSSVQTRMDWSCVEPKHDHYSDMY